jgi:hypothetical protein
MFPFGCGTSVSRLASLRSWVRLELKIIGGLAKVLEVGPPVELLRCRPAAKERINKDRASDLEPRLACGRCVVLAPRLQWHDEWRAAPP